MLTYEGALAKTLLQPETFVGDHECDVTGFGPDDSEVMLLGIAPGRDEATRSKRPFTGAAGRMLDACFDACQWSRDVSYTTNLICWWNDAPTYEQIAPCLPRLISEIERVKPKLIICAGTIVNDAFFKGILGYKKIPARGAVQWCEQLECYVMRTHHPAAFTYDDPKVDICDFTRDLLKIRHVVKWPRCAPAQPSYRVADSVEKANEILWNLHGYTAIDIENSYDFLGSAYEDEVDPDKTLLVRDPYGSCMLCFSVTNNEGTWIIPGLFMRDLRAGWGARSEVKWIMHGGNFDRGQFIRLLGETLTIEEDSLLQSYSLDERGGAKEEDDKPVGIHALKSLCMEYLGVPDWNVNVLKANVNDLHHYNAYDTAYDLRLFYFFRERQIEDDVLDMYRKLLIGAVNVFSDCQMHGVYIDRQAINTLALRWVPEAIQLEDELKSEAIARGWDADEPLNLASWPQMHVLVYDVLKVPYTVHGRTTRKGVLEEIVETYDEPWLDKLRRYRSVTHKISNWVEGLEDDIKVDHRAHPVPVLHGARTGRIAYKRPAVMTLPNKGVDPEMAETRKVICATPSEIAGEEMVLIEADYKQAEFWATWMLCRDDNLLQALLTGDIHGATAKRVFESIDETHLFWDIYRFMCKTLGFGALYGRGEKAFVEETFKGRAPPKGFEFEHWDLKKARAFIKSYADEYPILWQWRKDVVKRALADGEQINPNGRKRRYWLTNFKTVNQSVNFNSQSFGHDHLITSFIELHEPIKALHPWSHLLFEVHDSILCETPRRLLDTTVGLIKRVMETPKFGMEYGIPIDVKFGPNWYDTHEYKFEGVTH